MRRRAITISAFYFFSCVVIGFMLMAQTSCKKNPAATDHVVWADSVTEHFRNLMNSDKASSALRYIDSAYNAAPGLGIADQWKKYSVKVEYYNSIDYNPEKQQAFIDSMQALLKAHRLQYKFEYAHNLFLQGDLFQAEKKYSQAFQCYYDGRNFAAQNLDNCSLSDFSNCMANIYYNQGNYNKAIHMLKLSFSECDSCTTNNFQYRFTSPQAFLNTIGLCFEKGGEPDSAAVYYLKAIAFIDTTAKQYPQKEIFTSVARAVIQGNLGGLYSKQHKYDDAIKYMQQSIRNNDRERYAIEDAQLTKIKLASLYIQLNRFADAEKLINELHQDLLTGRGKSMAHTDVMGKWYRLSWLYYDKLQRIPDAYKFQSRYYAFTDSVNQNKNTLKNTDLDQAFKVHDQQFQLTLLGKTMS